MKIYTKESHYAKVLAAKLNAAKLTPNTLSISQLELQKKYSLTFNGIIFISK